MADEIAAFRPDAAHEAAHAAQRRHLRRILAAFVVVVVLLPLAGLGGALGWLLVPILLVAALALREGIRLRRSVRRYGHAGVSVPPRD